MNPHDYIDDYINGLLSDKDKSAFELLMSNDDDLRSLVKNYSEIKNTGSGILEMELLNSVEKVASSSSSSSSSSFKWIIITCILILLSIIFFLLYESDDPNTELNEKEIFAQMYKEPIWPIKRSVDINRVGEAVNLYLVNKDLQSAKLILRDSIDDRVLGHYWLSEIYANEGKWDSVSHYLSLGAHEDNLTRTKFLKVITLIYQRKIDEAKILAKDLPLSYQEKLSFDFIDQ